MTVKMIERLVVERQWTSANGLPIAEAAELRSRRVRGLKKLLHDLSVVGGVA